MSAVIDNATVVHVHLGGFAGTNINVAQCAKNSGHATAPCIAAFIGIHITSTASVYAEGTWGTCIKPMRAD